MLILKNLTESSGVLYLEVHRLSVFSLSFPPIPSLPQFTSERAFKFRKSGEIYSGTDCLFYPIPRIRVRSDHLRSFHLQGNFILGFRISSIFSASIRFFFFFFFLVQRCAAGSIRRSARPYGKPRDLFGT